MSSPWDLVSEPGESIQVAVVVAHPDDEILWAGGLLLSHPEWLPFIVTLCRGKDSDRAPKFQRVLARLGAKGAMADLDDGPDQQPLPPSVVKDTILALLPGREYELLLTHAPHGEYTWHRRHEEVARAVQELWRDGQLRAKRMWQFSYEDGGGAYAPRPNMGADLTLPLSEEVWTRKFGIITDLYGFGEASWEALAAARTEAFCCFSEPGSIPGPEAPDRSPSS